MRLLAIALTGVLIVLSVVGIVGGFGLLAFAVAGPIARAVSGPLELRRMLRGRIARARRYSQINRIALRHGLSPYLRGRRRAELGTPEGRVRLARSVRQALEEAGVTFVKLGQVLSTRATCCRRRWSRSSDTSRTTPSRGVQQGRLTADRRQPPRKWGNASRYGRRTVALTPSAGRLRGYGRPRLEASCGRARS
jgi:hypothetical protein